jgi:hypothetical protein
MQRQRITHEDWSAAKGILARDANATAAPHPLAGEVTAKRKLSAKPLRATKSKGAPKCGKDDIQCGTMTPLMLADKLGL